MKICISIAALLIATLPLAKGNSDMRDWTPVAGDPLRAELVEFNEATGELSLRREDKTIIKFKRDELSTFDKAWLLQWVEYKEEMEAMVQKLGGTIERKTGTGKFTTEYSVYHPSGSTPEARLPLMILFHPGGNGHREILRYAEAADAVKMTLVSCETFQNTGYNAEIADKLEADYLERFQELLPQIEKGVPHDPNRIFMGGVSGGGWRAFYYSVKIPRPWAGIYANSSWLGGKKYWDLPYPKMRVVFLNGDRDYVKVLFDKGVILNGGPKTNKDDIEVIRKSGSEISVQAFEGGHQAAPASVMTKSFRWLLKEIP